MGASRERRRGRGGPGASRWLAAAVVVAGAASARAASLSVPDGPVVLGRTESCLVLIQADDGPEDDAAPLRLAVNVGGFSEPVRIGPGRYRAVYTPPAARSPQVALIALWRETGPDARVEFLRLPLLGVARLPVSARPGARVRVSVGGETFGPVIADRSGRAVVPVVVPPGASEGQILLKERSGAEVSRSIPVEVPPYNRITAAIVPRVAVADGASAVRVEVFYDLDGDEVPPERIRVTPSVGSVSLRGASRGLYTFRYTPPADATAPGVSFAVSVAGDPAARTTAALALRSPPPARVLATPPPALRAGSDGPAAIDVAARGEAPPRLAAVPGPVEGPPDPRRDRGPGSEPRCAIPAGLGDGVTTARALDRPTVFSRALPGAHGPARGRLLAGFTAGYTRSPGVASGPRGAAELWVPFEAGEVRLGVGAVVGLGTASRTVSDATGTLRTTAEATFVPVALKIGYDAYASRRLSLTVGAGPMAAWARFRSTLASGAEEGLGLGWIAFLDLGLAAGPGVAVLGLSYGSAVVGTRDYRIDPGGLSATAGYRVRLF